MLFRFLLGVDILAIALVSYFFFAGLAEGTVSDFNAGIWGQIWAGIGAIMAVGLWLRRSGRPRLANLALAVLALPALASGAFLLVVMFSGAHHQ